MNLTTTVIAFHFIVSVLCPPNIKELDASSASIRSVAEQLEAKGYSIIQKEFVIRNAEDQRPLVELDLLVTNPSGQYEVFEITESLHMDPRTAIVQRPKDYKQLVGLNALLKGKFRTPFKVSAVKILCLRPQDPAVLRFIQRTLPSLQFIDQV
mgnify:CR=1 FL=1